jgi:hypothetical protein
MPDHRLQEPGVSLHGPHPEYFSPEGPPAAPARRLAAFSSRFIADVDYHSVHELFAPDCLL